MTLSRDAFTMLRYDLLTPTFVQDFYREGKLKFMKCSFDISGDDHVGFFLSLSVYCYILHSLILSVSNLLAFLELSQHDYGVWSLYCADEFDLRIFCWRLSHLWSLGVLFCCCPCPALVGIVSPYFLYVLYFHVRVYASAGMALPSSFSVSSFSSWWEGWCHSCVRLMSVFPGGLPCSLFSWTWWVWLPWYITSTTKTLCLRVL